MSSNGSTNAGVIWAWAVAAGILAFLVLKFMALYAFWPAILLAILIAILVAILLWIAFYRGGESDVSGHLDSAGSASGATGTGAMGTGAKVAGAAAAGAAGVAAAAGAGASSAASGVAGAASSAGAAAKSAAASGAAKVSEAAKPATPSPASSAKAAGQAASKPVSNPAASLMGDAGAALVSEKKAEQAKAASEAKPATKPAKSKASAKPATTPSAKKPAAKPAGKKSAAKKTGTAKPARKPVAKDGKPELLSSPRAGGADDLKQIKGVGPKLEKLLHKLGVYHFDQIAGWRKKEVEWVDEHLEGFKGRVSRDEWVKQAKVLARGGSTEFSKRVKKGKVY